MSRKLNRSTSAGTARQTLGIGIDGGESSALVQRLQQDLTYSKMETQRVKDQLNCLIALVKKAWNGDADATIHVATIVGVAPPEYHDHKDEDYINSAVGLSATLKSHALNNWARLTVGLLNREYCRLEREMQEKQTSYLMQRDMYLDEQMNTGYRGGASLLRKSNSFSDMRECRNGSGTGPLETLGGPVHQPPWNKPSSATQRKRPPVRHLYRVPQDQPEPDMHWGEVFGDLPPGVKGHAAENTNKTIDALYRLSNGHSENSKDPDKTHVSYADPRRYSQFGLFDADNAALEQETENRRWRPPSGKQQRMSDSMRARPKSAISTKGERPLKYETTRPVSAKSQDQKAPNGKPRQRRSSARSQKDQTFLTQNGDGHDEVERCDGEAAPGRPLSSKGRGKGNKADVNLSFDSEASCEFEEHHQVVDQNKQRLAQIKVKIKQPECIGQFEEDLQRMGSMEQDFRRTTLELQKKLGISTNAMV